MNFKISIILKSHWPKILSVFLFIILLGAYANIFAIGSPYNPGSTLDPDCAPGDENCTVSTGPWLTNSSGIYYGDGNVSVGGGVYSISTSVGGDVVFNTKKIDSISSSYFPSIALKENDIPVIAYYDDDNQDLIILSCEDEDCNDSIKTTIDASYLESRPMIEIGSDGLARVIYWDNYNIKYLTCTTDDCASYNTVSVTKVDDSWWDYEHDLALDEDNNPYIIYGDYSDTYYNYNVYISKYTGSGTENSCTTYEGDTNLNWKCILVSSSTDSNTNYFLGGQSLGDLIYIDPNDGLPRYYAEREVNPDEWRITYNKCNDIDCSSVTETIITEQSGADTPVSMDVNASGVPYIAFARNDNSLTPVNGNSNTIVIAYYVGGGDGVDCDYSNDWTCKDIATVENIDDPDTILNYGFDSYWYLDMKLDSNGNPSILIEEYTHTGDDDLKSKYFRCNDNYCNDVNMNLLHSTTNNLWSIVGYFDLDSNNYLRLAYSDFDDNLIYLREKLNPVISFGLNKTNNLSASDDAGVSGNLFVDGYTVLAKGVYLNNFIPENINQSLYNNSGSLYWNGEEVITGNLPDPIIASTSILGTETWLGNGNVDYIGDASTNNTVFVGIGAGKNATSANNSNFIGELVGEYAYNAYDSNFIGSFAGQYASSASISNFFGLYSGYQAYNAFRSNFIGWRAGSSSSNAYDSNFIGLFAGESAPYANTSNFIGSGAGEYATSASNSNFIGTSAGQSALYATHSNFIGFGAGQSANSSSYSNFFGYQAGYGATNARNSIFLGQYAGYSDTVNNTTNSNDWSILLGYRTRTGGYKNSVLIGGSNNTSWISNTKTNQFMLAPTLTEIRLRNIDYTLPSAQGGANTVLTNNGSGVLTWAASSGGGLTSNADYNTLGGTSAGLNLVSGAQYNTFIGYEAGRSASSGGTNAADNNMAIGYQSFYSNTTGYDNTASGIYSLRSNTTGRFNAAYGTSSLYSNTTGSYNSAFGRSSLRSNTTGVNNTAMGDSSLYYNITGSNNTSGGANSLYYNSIGFNNSAYGTSSLNLNKTGNNNTAGGYYSLFNNITGIRNTGQGSYSLNNIGKTVTAGSFIVGVSYTIQGQGTTDFTLIGAANNSAGTVFTATGVGSGTGIASPNSNNNTAIGYQSGNYITGGSIGNISSSNSLYIGADTKASVDGGFNEIVIGYNTTGNGSNTTTIGTGNVLYVGGSTITGKVARFTNSAGYCDINPTTTSLVCSSDINLKKNITNLKGDAYTLPISDIGEIIENEEIITDDEDKTTLEKLISLTPVLYNWNGEEEGASKHSGFIAQEVEEIFPDLVFTDADTKLKSLSYSGFTPYIIEAIKEMNLKIENLEIAKVENGESSMMGDFFNSILTKVEDGIAYLSNLVVDTIEVGSQEKRTGITLYDEETGDPYCITIVNGEMINREGECGVVEMPDICPNIDEYQQEIPGGYELNENNECIEVYIEKKSIDLELEKKVDVCSNIEGMQSNMPEGYNLGGDDECIKQDLEIPVDPSSLFTATPGQE